MKVIVNIPTTPPFTIKGECFEISEISGISSSEGPTVRVKSISCDKHSSFFAKTIDQFIAKKELIIYDSTQLYYVEGTVHATRVFPPEFIVTAMSKINLEEVAKRSYFTIMERDKK